MSDQDVKKNVREFYDRVGWQKTSEDLFQNAEYEDLRPVSRDYIHKCHMRVKRHLAAEGDYLLDAGSGPVQYPEYVTYSEGYKARVCMDISIVALQEARKHLGDHGMYVVGDVAHLPFAANTFDGIVSLHTVHHVPLEEKVPAYEGLYRVLKPGKSMVSVDGWTGAPLMARLAGFMEFMRKLRRDWERKKKQEVDLQVAPAKAGIEAVGVAEPLQTKPSGTFVQKLDAAWLIKALDGKMPFQIFVWRSVSVNFLRSVIHADWGGRFWLSVIYRLEEWFPQWLGKVGQYPLIVVEKPETESGSRVLNIG